MSSEEEVRILPPRGERPRRQRHLPLKSRESSCPNASSWSCSISRIDLFWILILFAFGSQIRLGHLYPEDPLEHLVGSLQALGRGSMAQTLGANFDL